MKQEIYGVILAAGAGTRLGFPNSLGGKAMAVVAGEPLLNYGLQKLQRGGISKIALVVNPENAGIIKKYAGDGGKWGVKITYIIQEKPLGIAHALGLCQAFAKGHKILLLLADNLFSQELAGAVAAFGQNQTGARTFLIKVDNPEDYGVAVLAGDLVTALEEKPKEFLSPWAVVGIYLYDTKVFEIIKTLKPSARGELEITDVNKAYLAAGELGWTALAGWWVDVGTEERLQKAAQLISGKVPAFA